MSSRQTRKRSRLDKFLDQFQEDIDDPDDCVEELEDSDDDGEYVPSSPEVHELKDAADDNDGDDPPPSPKMATSKTFSAREATRTKRNQTKAAMKEAREAAKKVSEALRAKKAPRIRSPTPSRPNTPASHESDEFSPRRKNDAFSPRQQKTPRTKTSMVWNHLTENDEVAKCKYCDKSWKIEASKGSTSNFRTHIIQKHQNKLSEADKIYLEKGNPNTPRRANLRTFMENAPRPPGLDQKPLIDYF